ncbi:MAG: carboxylating nicotinate-nucleotide diphosphorylase [Candidatus Margulisiibacteriota bacterium]
MTNDKLRNLINSALKEDIGSGDITTNAIIPAGQKAKAAIRAKEAGVICGLDVAADVFKKIDRRIKLLKKVKDGAKVKNGQIVAVVSGPARGILTGERVALNFLQHLSGIATLTRKFKIQISKSKNNVKLLDTRKTIPGLRVLEKSAVKTGGGVNHRLGLYDAILIKDNHIKLAGGIGKAIEKAKAKAKGIEVETKTISEVKKAIGLKVDRILLDNMSLKVLCEAVKLCKKAKIKTEASGGINLNNVAAIAKTGVDFISIGALTHSAKALDISLKAM